MKAQKFTLLLLGMTAMFAAQAQTYCVPPPFTSGPFTGIISVSIGEDWEHTSPGTDGYKYFDEIEAPELVPGEEYTIVVDAEHTLTSAFSGNLNYRVWIDWNQDGDFEDDEEEVLMVQQHHYTSPAEAHFIVPEDAEEGTTRMRVYEDMLVDEGHDIPNPCGYLSSTNPVGHHGESEDYNVEIVSSNGGGGGGGNEPTDPSEWPVGIQDVEQATWDVTTDQAGNVRVAVEDATGDVRIQLTNLVGQNVYVSPNYATAQGTTFDLGSYPSGIYIVQVAVDGVSTSRKVYIP